MNWLTDIMIQALNFFYGMTGNYGWSIIFLTVAINIALYPLTLSSIIQMAAIQRVQPKIQEIQKKLKDQPQKMQEELMKVYKEEKVNPFGGCLPMLLKIPFFIGFFFAIQSDQFKALLATGGHKASFLWIPNIAQSDHLYILVILIAISTYLAQKTMPGSQNTQMKTMNTIMPFFIAFISIQFPSGVQIYWIVSNTMSIAQQVFINRFVLKKKNVSRETF